MPSLIAVDIHGRNGFLHQIQDIWERGDAVLPVDTRVPDGHLEQILGRLRPAQLVRSADDVVTLPDAVPVDEGTALVVATSGTTGAPKGVVHTHHSMEAASRITASATATDITSIWVACLPLAHIGGFSVITRALHADAGLLVLDGFNHDEVVTAADSGATHVSLVPTVLGRIDPQQWQVILLGGSRIPEDRPVNSVATYGMTETFGGVVYDGAPLEGVDVRVDPRGRLEIRSPTLFSGYRSFGSPPPPTSMTSDGYLFTGDIGSVDPVTGMVTIDGRSDDLIITGGVKVWPEPVEQVISEHPGVRECAVIGLADDEWGQCVTAVVVPTAPMDVPTLDSLRGLVKEQLPGAHAPRRLIITDHLERTASGKIRRNDIRFRAEDPYHL